MVEEMDQHQDGANCARPLVLIVEDDLEIRRFIVRELAPEYEIEEAGDGQDGCDKAFESMPDLVICDVMMPRMDGRELCHRLKDDSRTSHIPILMLTALHSESQTIEGLQSGADEYVTKPFSIRILRQQCRNLIESRRLLRERYRREFWLQPHQVTITSVDKQFLEQLIVLIEEHISDFELGAEFFAERMHVSPRTLYRKLKALTDQSFNIFLRTIRLRRAAQMLESTGLTISEVAYHVGFIDTNYFSRCFKELFDVSPSDYVKRARDRGRT